MPAQSQALRYLHFPSKLCQNHIIIPILQTGNKIKDSLSHLPKVTQLITMEVGVETQTVLFQRPNSFCETSTFPIILYCDVFTNFHHPWLFSLRCVFGVLFVSANGEMPIFHEENAGLPHQVTNEVP